MKKILIGSDKSGYFLKEAIKAYLLENGYAAEDAGPYGTEEARPYYVTADAAAKRIAAGEFERGILICGTGMGMAIVANKYPGVYAAVCENTFAAEKARAINDANVLTMGAWITGEFVGCEMARIFLKTGFTENLEDWRAKNLHIAREEVGKIESKIYGK